MSLTTAISILKSSHVIVGARSAAKGLRDAVKVGNR
jgi:hypothetical protein